MSEQLNFDQIIRNTNEGHLSCALLLDTSGSMEGAAIAQLSSLSRMSVVTPMQKTGLTLRL